MMRVAVIGTGVMGSAIARRLLATDTVVVVHNRTPARCAPLVAAGAQLAPSPADAAKGADHVVLSLNSADIVEQMVFGEGGVAHGAGGRALLVDMSSIDPRSTAQFARRLRAERGVGWVDAPLSGGAPAALRGELTLMLGGDAEDIARAEPLLSKLSARRTHFGPPGSGQTVKLVNQLLVAQAFLAVAEATRFAESQGVDPARIPAALAGGRADSRVLQEFMAKMGRRDYSPTGRLANMVKDLDAVERAADAAGLGLRVTRLVNALHRRLVEAGHGEEDNAALMRLFDLPDGPR